MATSSNAALLPWVALFYGVGVGRAELRCGAQVLGFQKYSLFAVSATALLSLAGLRGPYVDG